MFTHTRTHTDRQVLVCVQGAVASFSGLEMWWKGNEKEIRVFESSHLTSRRFLYFSCPEAPQVQPNCREDSVLLSCTKWKFVQRQK